MNPQITMRLVAEYSNAWKFYSRPAPPLPDGVSWIEGMHFEDSDDEGSLKVRGVLVKKSGDVVVMFREVYEGEFTAEADAMFTSTGWKQEHNLSLEA